MSPVERLKEVIGGVPIGYHAWSTYAKYMRLADRLHNDADGVASYEQRAIAEALGVSRFAVRRAEMRRSGVGEGCGCVR